MVRAVVGAADPLVAGAELELGDLRLALTASRVANRVGTSTPLSAGRVCVLVMVDSPLGWWSMTTPQTLGSRTFPGPSLAGRRANGPGKVRGRPAADSSVHEHTPNHGQRQQQWHAESIGVGRPRHHARSLGPSGRRGVHDRRSHVSARPARATGSSSRPRPRVRPGPAIRRPGPGIDSARARERRSAGSLAAVGVSEHHWLGHQDGRPAPGPAGQRGGSGRSSSSRSDRTRSSRSGPTG